MRKYLVVILDGSDVQATLVDQITFDWINRDYHKPGESSWRETLPGTKKRVVVTIGSSDNDRALHVMGAAKDTFDSITEAVQACYDVGDRLGGDYVGLSY